MRPFWHPLSAVLLPEPRTFATPVMLRMMLGAHPTIVLLYAGDGMWPSVRHGESFTAESPRTARFRRGEVVLACPSGIPDLVRVDQVEPDCVKVVRDADPGDGEVVPNEGVLALAQLQARRAGRFRRAARRLLLDLREATRSGLTTDEDPGSTVRAKYETQAPFYAAQKENLIDPALLARIRREIPPGRRILVAGSGAGGECLILAEGGWSVAGVDFAPTMVNAARAAAAQRGLDVLFTEADLRAHRQAPASLGGVLFTYDVYSFLSDREERIRLLGTIRRWLEPGGVLFLSARRARSPYDLAILALQYLARGRSRGLHWGASHTRWISPKGVLQRSFVHVFSERSLRRETAAAGFVTDGWERGHLVLRPRAATSSSGITQ